MASYILFCWCWYCPVYTNSLSTAELHLWLLPDFSQTCSPTEQAPEPSQPGTAAAAVLGAERQRGQHPCTLCHGPAAVSPQARGLQGGMGMEREWAVPSPRAGRGCPRAAPPLGTGSSDGTTQPTGTGMISE